MYFLSGEGILRNETVRGVTHSTLMTSEGTNGHEEHVFTKPKYTFDPDLSKGVDL